MVLKNKSWKPLGWKICLSTKNRTPSAPNIFYTWYRFCLKSSTFGRLLLNIFISCVMENGICQFCFNLKISHLPTENIQFCWCVYKRLECSKMIFCILFYYYFPYNHNPTSPVHLFEKKTFSIPYNVRIRADSIFPSNFTKFTPFILQIRVLKIYYMWAWLFLCQCVFQSDWKIVSNTMQKRFSDFCTYYFNSKRLKYDIKFYK